MSISDVRYSVDTRVAIEHFKSLFEKGRFSPNLGDCIDDNSNYYKSSDWGPVRIGEGNIKDIAVLLKAKICEDEPNSEWLIEETFENDEQELQITYNRYGFRATLLNKYFNINGQIIGTEQIYSVEQKWNQDTLKKVIKEFTNIVIQMPEATDCT